MSYIISSKTSRPQPAPYKKKKKGRKKMENKRNTKKVKRGNTKKQVLKRVVVELIAKCIYYSIIATVSTATILLFFGTLGAVVELCTNNKLYCICYLVVCGYIITRFIVKELNK